MFGILGRQLEVEVVQAVVAEQVEHEPQQRRQLVAHLVAGAVDVRVVHRQAAHPGQAVHHAGELVAVDRAEFEEPQRKFAI